VQTIVYPLASLLYISPLFSLLDGLAVLGIFLLALALALILTRPTIPPREAQFIGEIIWPVLGVAALPAAFMIFQLLPLPTVAHPAWQSTASALGSPLPGSISIDEGATLLVLCRYCAFWAGVLLSAVVCVNRARAGKIYVAALFATTAVAALYILTNLGSSPANTSASFASEQRSGDDVLLIACFGLILSVAFALMAYKNRAKGDSVLGRLIPTWAFGLAGAAVCAAALLRAWNGPTAVAICVGLIALALVALARRLGLLVGGVLAATALIVSLVLLAHSAGRSNLDITLRFAPGTQTQFETVQRIVQDEPAFGTGAGTFASLLQLYRSTEDRQSHDLRSPFVAVVGVEMGRGFLLITLGVLSIASALLFRAAIRRGRDWIYPAATASCLVTAIVLAFAAPTDGSPALLLMGATILGLGLAQSRSRTAQ